MTKCPLPIGSESFSAVKQIRYECIFILNNLCINKTAVLTLVQCQKWKELKVGDILKIKRLPSLSWKPSAV